MMSGNNENPADKAKTDELYENREPKKIIRIITVTAYMISVSFVGIVLSAYYIFLWHPPNPRLMHAMAHEGHHERLVSGPELMSQEAPVPIVSNFDRMAQSRFSGPVDDREIDVLADHFGDEAETVKRRREIVNNVNSFLSANFEKSQLRGIVGEETTISSLTQDTTEQVESTSTVSGQSPETSQETTTSMSPPQLFPSTKRIRNSAKKQQQMPFALKHLEVPIQSDRLKKRSARISSPSDSLTIGNAYIPSDSKDAALDKSKLPIESSDNTPAYVAAVIGERPSEPRPLGVMGLLKKLSSNNQPETPSASKNQQKDQYRLSKDTSESPILNRLPDYEEELAGTSELPDLVDD